jgi:hypothetical protein
MALEEPHPPHAVAGSAGQATVEGAAGEGARPPKPLPISLPNSSANPLPSREPGSSASETASAAEAGRKNSFQKFQAMARKSFAVGAQATKRRIWINMPPQPLPGDPPSFFQATKTQVFHSNEIHTRKYTLFTFLPKNLFEQFRGLANFYFLTLVILQTFDRFMFVSPIVTSAPVLIIVAVTAVKVGAGRVNGSRRMGASHQVTVVLTPSSPPGSWLPPPHTGHHRGPEAPRVRPLREPLPSLPHDTVEEHQFPQAV